jgi:hypothetical protein
MSRSPMSVTSDILGLRILINDVIQSLKSGPALPTERREALSSSFHRYIRDERNSRLRPNGLFNSKGSVRLLPSSVVRQEAADDSEKILSTVERYATGALSKKEVGPFVEFLRRLDTALDRSRADIRISRYL